MSLSGVVRRSCLLALVFAAMALGACGQEDEDRAEAPARAEPPKEMSLVATDAGMTFPKTVEAEPVSIVMRNDGEKPHTAILALLKQGVTLDELRTARPQDLLKLVVPAAGMEEVPPGGRATLTIDLPEGQYALIREEDRVLTSFEVVPAGGPRVQTPQADYKVEAGDFYFKMPPNISAGQVTFAITNVGGQAHEFGFVKRAAHSGQGAGEHAHDEEGGHTEQGGQTEQGAHSEEEGEHLFTPPPGGTVWAQFNIEPGTYTVECHLPDENTGKEHIELGMKTQFTAT